MHTYDFRQFSAIDDLLLAFLLLQCDWNDGTRRRLMTPLGAMPYIEKQIFGSGYTGDEYSGSDYYLVTDRVIALLLQGRYLEGQKHLGYTDERELALRADEFVYNTARALRQEFAEEARRFLAEKHPDYKLPREQEHEIAPGYPIWVQRLGHCFVAAPLPDVVEEDRVIRRSVNRANGVLTLCEYKFPESPA